MALLDDIQTDIAAVFLDDVGGFARQYEQRPNGTATAPATLIAAVVEIKDREPSLSRGKGYDVRGRLWTASTHTLSRRDLWIIDGHAYSVEALDDPVDGADGLVCIHLYRYESELEGQPTKAR